MNDTYYTFDSALRAAVHSDTATAIYKDGSKFVFRQPIRRPQPVAVKTTDGWITKAVS